MTPFTAQSVTVWIISYIVPTATVSISPSKGCHLIETLRLEVRKLMRYGRCETRNGGSLQRASGSSKKAEISSGRHRRI